MMLVLNAKYYILLSEVFIIIIFSEDGVRAVIIIISNKMLFIFKLQTYAIFCKCEYEKRSAQLILTTFFRTYYIYLIFEFSIFNLLIL